MSKEEYSIIPDAIRKKNVRVMYILSTRITLAQAVTHNAAVNEFHDTPHRGAIWGICFLGVPKTQKSPQPGAVFCQNPLITPR